MKSQKAYRYAIPFALLALTLSISNVKAQSIIDQSCVAHIIGQHAGSQVNIRSGALIDARLRCRATS